MLSKKLEDIIITVILYVVASMFIESLAGFDYRRYI